MSKKIKDLEIKSPINGEAIVETERGYIVPDMFNLPKVLAGVELDVEELIKLSDQPTVGPYEFKKSNGEGTFKAWLTWNQDEKNLEFAFDDGSYAELEEVCPKSNKPIRDRGEWFQFLGYEGIKFYKVMAQREMKVSEYIDLLDDEGEELEGFVGKSGSTFSAKLGFDAESKWPVSFVFEKKEEDKSDE